MCVIKRTWLRARGEREKQGRERGEAIHRSPKNAIIPPFFRLQAYKNYVSAFLNRKNTITGLVYKDDPVIMSVEVSEKTESRGDWRGIDPLKKLTSTLPPPSSPHSPSS